jgi:hypothetical protein
MGLSSGWTLNNRKGCRYAVPVKRSVKSGEEVSIVNNSIFFPSCQG